MWDWKFTSSIDYLSISHTKQNALPKYYPTHFDCEACTLEFDQVIFRCPTVLWYISVCRWPRIFTYIYFRIIDYRTHSRTRISCSYDDSCMRVLPRSRYPLYVCTCVLFFVYFILLYCNTYTHILQHVFYNNPMIVQLFLNLFSSFHV